MIANKNPSDASQFANLMVRWDSDSDPDAETAFSLARRALRDTGQKFVDIVVDRNQLDEALARQDELAKALEGLPETATTLQQALEATEQEIAHLNRVHTSLRGEVEHYKRHGPRQELGELREIRDYIMGKSLAAGKAFPLLQAEKSSLEAQLNTLSREKKSVERELSSYRKRTLGITPATKIGRYASAFVVLGCFIIGGLFLVRNLRPQAVTPVTPSSVPALTVVPSSPPSRSHQRPYWCSEKPLDSTQATICNDPVLSQKDIDITDLYLGIARALRTADARSPQTMSALTRLHDSWIRNRGNCGTQVPCLLEQYTSHQEKIIKTLNP